MTTRRPLVFLALLLLALHCAPCPAAVTPATPRVQYVSTGGAAYAFTWPIWAKTDLEVYVGAALQTVDAHYTVTFTAGAAVGGSITFVSAPASGQTVTIRRATSQARTSDFAPSGPFSTAALNSQLDRLTAQTQDLKEQVSRSATYPPYVNTPGPYLPTASDGALLRWSGSNLENFTPALGLTAGDAAIQSYFEGTGAGTAAKVKGVWHVATSGVSDHGNAATVGSAAAIDTANPGSILRFPPGTYAFATAWTPSAGATLDLSPGAVLQFPAVSAGLIVSNSSITIRGQGTLRGNAGAPTTAAVVLVSGTDFTLDGPTVDAAGLSAGRAVDVNGGARCTIRNATLTGTHQAGVYVRGVVNDLVVTGNRHTGNGYGVLINDPAAGSARALISDNYFVMSGAGPGDGIEINAPTNGFTEFIIAGNYITGYKNVTGNEGIGIGLARCSYGSITGNTITGCQNDGIHIEGHITLGPYTDMPSQHITVAGNTIRAVGKNGGTGQSGGIALIGSDYCTITGNTISTVLDTDGIFVGDKSTSERSYLNNVITSNTIFGTSKNGIRASAQRGLVIANNTITAVRESGTFSNISHIRLTNLYGAPNTACDDFLIQGNVLADGATAATVGIFVDSNNNNGDVVRNNLKGVATKLSISGTNVEVQSNRLTTDPMSGTFTATAGTSTIVANGNVYRRQNVRITPISSGAAALTGVFISSATAGVDFRLTHSAAAGTETFAFEL